MRYIKQLKILTILTLTVLTGVACDSNSSSDNGDMATISGRVESDTQSKSVTADAYIVTAATINSDGSFSAIDGTETQTDASGNFELMVDASMYQNIVVMAENNAEVMYSMTSEQIENSQSYMVKPVSVESSAETKVFAELYANGDADMVMRSEIEAVINSAVSSEINSNSSAVADMAASLKTAAEVRASYLQEEFNSEASAKMDEIFTSSLNAQIQLENSLNAATSLQAQEEAYDTFNQAIIDAYLDAEVKASTTAKLFEMWGRVLVNNSTELSADAKNEFNKQISIYTSTVVDAAVMAEAEAANVEESTRTAIAQAGADLEATIRISTGVASEIEAAFEEYHDEVRTALENDANFSSEIVIGIDTQINSTTGAKSDFESSFTASLNADLFVNIYTSFFSSIENTVDSMSDSSTNVAALTEIMILINTAS
ncbi:MAG TPA: hypothetical protein DEQ34_11005 [Balneolaceae bacterium]|nr:hypothetical protein [Balneolaceae bacterium]